MKQFLFILVVFTLSGCQSFRLLSGQPNEADINLAVKQLMGSSVFQTLTTLERLQREQPETLLPEALQPALQTLRLAGYGNQIDAITRELSKVSEVALVEMREVMRESIAQTSFTDGAAILLGNETTAIQVLKNNGAAVVQQRYSRLIEAQLTETDIPTYFPIAAHAYNLFAREKIPTQIGDFLSLKAVDVLFTMAGHREQELRNSTREIGEDTAIRVLGYYQNRQQKKKRQSL